MNRKIVKRHIESIRSAPPMPSKEETTWQQLVDIRTRNQLILKQREDESKRTTNRELR